MVDLFLRSIDQIEMDATLMAAGLINVDGAVLREGLALDRIGQDPVHPLTELVMPGYHINLYFAAPVADGILDALVVVTIAPPDLPYRLRA